MIYAARAAGIMPLGYIASVASFGDLSAFRRMVQRSRQFGFLGASCIHPAQVTIVNELYSPSAEGEYNSLTMVTCAGWMQLAPRKPNWRERCTMRRNAERSPKLATLAM